MKNYLLSLLAFIIFNQTIFSQIVDIPDYYFKSYLLSLKHEVDGVYVKIDINNDKEIQVSEAESFKGRIDPRENSKINNFIGLEAFKNISSLTLTNAYCCYRVGRLDVSTLKELETLSISGMTKLSSLDVSNNTKLKVLEVGNTNIESLDISNNTKLEILTIKSKTDLKLDISNNLELTKISYVSLPIETLDLSNHTKLEDLSLVNTGITEIDLSNNINLTRIFCPGNTSLRNLDVSNNINLDYLNCNSTSVASLNLKNNIKLKTLYIEKNLIDAIDLSSNTKLSNISITDSNISSLDLSKNKKLSRIYCKNTMLTNLDLSYNSNLKISLIYDNPLLEYVNMRNGNNHNINYFERNEEYSFKTKNNPNLEFICVDDLLFANKEFTDVEDHITFTTDCKTSGLNGNIIQGQLNYDISDSDCLDETVPVKNKIITVSQNNDSYGTITNNEGYYTINVPFENTVEVKVSSLAEEDYIFPEAQQVELSGSGFGNITFKDFCTPYFDLNNIKISMVPISDARPGFESSYFLIYENTGGSIASGQITINFSDEFMLFKSSSETPTQINSNNITWDYEELQPFEINAIEVKFTISPPPIVNINDILHFYGEINFLNSNSNIETFPYELDQLVIGSYDPNDITVFEGESITPEQTDDYLNYRIRFQNSGTAEAINVYIENTLDDNLDWNTLQIVGSSHTYEVEIKNENQLRFTFEDIDLPYEDQDYEGSMGYIIYKIKPKSDIQLGDIVKNQADIIFDFNEPIITNEVQTTVALPTLALSDVEKRKQNISIYPNPVSNEAYISSDNDLKINDITLFSLYGSQILSIQPNTTFSTLDIKGLSSGIYFVRVRLEDNSENIFKIQKQ